MNYWEQQLQSHIDTGQENVNMLENNIPFADNQNSGWPVVSNLPLAPSPRMLRLWHTALVYRQSSEKQSDRKTIPPWGV